MTPGNDDPEDEEGDGVTGTYGEAGIADRAKTLVIGKPPEIRRTAVRLSADGQPLEWRTTIDMNPVVISYARLFTLLEEARKEGKPAEFLGHVFIKL